MGLALAGIDREVWAATGEGTSESTQNLALSQHRFEENLSVQLKNHSLPGESDLNERLAAKYQALCLALTDLSAPATAANRHRHYDREIAPALLELKVLLGKILGMNQQAILATRENVQPVSYTHLTLPTKRIV